MKAQLIDMIRRFAFAFGASVLLSCHSAGHTSKPADNTGHAPPADTAVVLDNNLVRAEAPDATAKAEQGYCLPHGDSRKAQSPINILTLNAKVDARQDQLIKFETEVDAAENLGHTIQLDFKDGSICRIGNESYAARQFHFHTPSEHLIDGVTYPMEMHIVNMSTDSEQKAKSSYLVIAVLFKMGRPNKFLDEFLRDVPVEEGKKDSIVSGTVNFSDLSAQMLTNSKASFFTYNGSLTTSPFTEQVSWVVLKRVLEASPDQIMAIEKMEGNNARHIQTLNDRPVISH